MNIILNFGALCYPLVEQLEAQGIKNIPDKINQFQNDADAITHLRLSELITNAQANKARNKLLKNIIAELEITTRINQ